MRLNGLPPTPADVDTFLADKSANAYETVVDRLLASPHYAAEPHGRAVARRRPVCGQLRISKRRALPRLGRIATGVSALTIVICRTLEFLMEQLAGDLLPNATREERLATAFSRLHRQTARRRQCRSGMAHGWVADRVNTFSYAVMGLTFKCARCHDHKFDPITQRQLLQPLRVLQQHRRIRPLQRHA